MFESANASIVEKIIGDVDKITDFKPLVNPAILTYLKEKKIEVANVEKLIIAEEPKEEKAEKAKEEAEKPKEEAEKPKEEVVSKPVEAKEEVEHKEEKK